MISLFFLTSFFMLASGAQNVITDSTATVLAYWNKGSKAKYILKQTKDRYQKGKKVSGGSSSSAIDITVADATDSTYTIHWKYNKITVQGADNADPLLQKLTRLVENVTFKYTIGSGGDFIELLNWQEVQSMVNTALDEMTRLYKTREAGPYIEQTKKVFSSRQSIEELMMKDVRALHSAYGLEYKLHEKLTAETALPNFLGGNPFSAILTIEMTVLDRINKTCVIEMNQVLDKEKSTKEISDFLEKAGKPAVEKLPVIDISDKYIFTVELNTGWMKKVTFTRTAMAEDNTNVEKHEIIKL